MNNSSNDINTNISGISKAKTIKLDTSCRKIFKKIPLTSRLNINKKKNCTLPKSQKKLFSLLRYKRSILL